MKRSWKNWMRIGIFSLTFLSFLLPFVTVSCGDVEILTFTGFDLVIGKTVEIPDENAYASGLLGYDPDLPRKDEARTETARSGVVTLSLILVGLALGIAVWGRTGKIQRISAFASLMSAILLMYFRMDTLRAMGQATTEAPMMKLFEIHFRSGYWAALLGSIAGFIVEILPFRFFQGGGEAISLEMSPWE